MTILGLEWEEIWSLLRIYGQNHWVWVGAGGVVFLTLVLVYLTRKQPVRIRAFGTEKGYVEIARVALVDMIRTNCERLDIGRKPGVRIRTRNKRLHLSIRIRMHTGVKLTDVCSRLQDELTLTLKEGLGIERMGSINVIVVGVKPPASAIRHGKEARKLLQSRSIPVEATPLKIDPSGAVDAGTPPGV